MKRPPGFFPIGLWCSLALLIQVSYLARPAKDYQAAGEAVPALWYFLPLLACGFCIWQIVGLFQLRRFNRWFAVVFFLAWTTTMFGKYLVFSGPLVKPGRVLSFLSIIGIFNLVSAWYLARRSFREFAVRYVAEHKAERHSRLMQIAAQKNTLDEIRKSKTR